MTDRQLFEAYIRQKHTAHAADHILAVLPGTDVYRWAETVQRYEDFCAGRAAR